MLRFSTRRTETWRAARLVARAAILALALAVSASSVPSPGYADGEPGTPKYAATVNLRETSLHALETLWRQQPVNATYLGVHRYDAQLASFTPAARASSEYLICRKSSGSARSTASTSAYAEAV